MPNETCQVDVQPRDTAISQRPTLVTCKWKLQGLHEMAGQHEIPVVTGVLQPGFAGPAAGSGHFKFDDCFALDDSAADHPCSDAKWPPKLYAVGYPTRTP